MPDKFFYKKVKKHIEVFPQTPFEYNYFLCATFQRDFRHKTMREKLDKLIELSKIKLNKEHFYIRKRKPHKSKKLCFVCKKNFSSFQHHMILIKNGGYDCSINRIPICHDCHEIIHPWLQRIEK